MKIYLRDILVIDTETTGLESHDEIIQFTALRGDGVILYNSYHKPERLSAWPEAEAINGISPDNVVQCLPFRSARATVEKLFSASRMVIGYNLPFDLRMIRQGGVELPMALEYLDIMDPFARLYWKASGLVEKSSWVSLSIAADYYHYAPSGNYHDSLEDCRATLYVFQCMCRDGILPYAPVQRSRQ